MSSKTITKKNKPNGNYSITIIFLVGLLFLMLFVIRGTTRSELSTDRLISESNSVKSIGNTSGDLSNRWQRYSNSELGFSLHYPTYWIVENELLLNSGQMSLIKSYEGTDPWIIVEVRSNLKQLTAQELTEEDHFLINSTSSKVDQEVIVVKGVESLKVENPLTRAILIPTNSYIYTLTLEKGSPDGGISNSIPKPEDEEVFNNILESFTIFDPVAL